MENTVSLNEARAIRADDNKLWTPEDCIAAVLRDIRNGEIKPSRIIVVYEEDFPNDGGGRISAYRANMTRHEEVAVLSMKLHFSMHGWMIQSDEP
jgi:hypothetical protein